MTWFLDPSSHWPLYYDLAFQTHVLSLDFDHRPAHIKAIEFLPTLPFPCQCQSCFCQICSVSGCLAGCGFWRVYISMNICCMAACCSSTVIGSWMRLQDCIFNCFYLLVEYAELCQECSSLLLLFPSEVLPSRFLISELLLFEVLLVGASFPICWTMACCLLQMAELLSSVVLL